MLQTSLLLMKSLNKTEIPIFLSVVCSLFPRAIFLTFIRFQNVRRCNIDFFSRVNNAINAYKRQRYSQSCWRDFFYSMAESKKNLKATITFSSFSMC